MTGGGELDAEDSATGGDIVTWLEGDMYWWE